MEIKVTSCADCPFAECDYDGTLKYYCYHFNTPLYDVNSYYKTESVHPSCPLKQSPITVKLETDDLLNELRKSEIY